MNQFTGQGLLVRFEERTVGQNGNRVAAMTIVLSAPRRKNKQTGQWESQGDGTFLDIEAWNLSPAKVQYLGANVKNSLVTVIGRLQQDRWTDQSGGQRTKIKVVADTVDAKPKPQRRDGGQSQAAPAAQTQAPAEATVAAGGGADADIPF